MSFLLTIDDGPSEDALVKLEYLNQHGIKAVWFCLGVNLKKRPEIAREIINAGHVIANHSFSHARFSDIDFDAAAREISSTEEVIDDLYESARAPRPARLFRFPYGVQGGDPDKKQKLEDYLRQLNFVSMPAQVEFYDGHINATQDVDWLWSYDIQEWAIGNSDGLRLSAESVKANLEQYLGLYNKNLQQVILIHDHERSTQYFRELIDLLLQNNTFAAPGFAV
jgi:peptidoglycan/xylan/chitin deacetylase (PgdA/CDA1 family)